jgi:hypothetical protein
MEVFDSILIIIRINTKQVIRHTILQPKNLIRYEISCEVFSLICKAK